MPPGFTPPPLNLNSIDQPTATGGGISTGSKSFGFPPSGFGTLQVALLVAGAVAVLLLLPGKKG